MRTIEIVSRKYDGSLRDEYEAFLYTEDDERLVVYVPAGTLSYDHRKQAWSEAPDGLLEIYFKTRWYSVWHICEQTSNLNQMYIHLSMRAKFPGMQRGGDGVWRFSKPPEFPLLFSVQVRKPQHSHH